MLILIFYLLIFCNFLGKVGILKNVFRFDMPEQAYHKQGKKMNEPYLQVTDLLNSEKSVSAHAYRKKVARGAN